MEYYKIIRNGTVVGAGTTFLKWYPSKRQFFYCDIDSAERVQDFLTETMYHADWLRDAPSGATEALEADVRIIDATEYDEIIEQLGGGETIPDEPDPEPEIPDEPSEDPEPYVVQRAKRYIAKGEYFYLNKKLCKAKTSIANGAILTLNTNYQITTIENELSLLNQ